MTPPPKLPSRKRPAASPGPKAREMFGALSDGRLREVDTELIDPNPHQPRQRFDPDALALLAASIQARGLLHPPLCRPPGPDGRYELIAGERRWRAVQTLGWAQIEVLIKDTDAATSLEDALIENTARADLSPIEEARAYATLVEDLGLKPEQVGQRVGRSRSSVTNHIRLLDLPEEALELIDTDQLNFAHGRELLAATGETLRAQLAEQAVRHGWSSRQLAAAVANAAQTKPARRTVTPARKKVAAELQDAFRTADPNVSVRAGADDRFTITVTGSQAARALARRLQTGDGA